MVSGVPRRDVQELQVLTSQPGRKRRVRVAEQAERARGGPQGVHRIHLVEDVRVFVEWRPVADFGERADRDRARGERLEVLAVAGGQHPPGHGGTRARRLVEVLPVVEAARGAIVVAADRGGDGQIAQAVDDQVRLGAVAHQIAQQQQLQIAVAGRVGQHAVERVDVGVNVTQDEVTHRSYAPSHSTTWSARSPTDARDASSRTCACAYASRRDS